MNEEQNNLNKYISDKLSEGQEPWQFLTDSLCDIYGMRTITEALHASDGGGMDASQIVWAFVPSVISNSPFEIKELQSLPGLLMNCHICEDADELACALKEGFRSLNDVPALVSSSLLQVMTPRTVAKAMCSEDGGGYSPELTARAMASYSGGMIRPEFVAVALYSADGANLSAEGVARALSDDGLALRDENLVDILNSELGLGLSHEETAKALYYTDGANMSTERVANALWNGLKDEYDGEYSIDDVKDIMIHADFPRLIVEKTLEEIVNEQIKP